MFLHNGAVGDATFVKYGKVELTLPSPAAIPAAFGQLSELIMRAMTMNIIAQKSEIAAHLTENFPSVNPNFISAS